MEESKTFVRLFTAHEDGTCRDRQDEYELEQLGGEVPAPGDFIVDPGGLQGSDRSDPANHTVYQVAARYFLPRTTEHVYVAVAVTERPGREEEREILRA